LLKQSRNPISSGLKQSEHPAPSGLRRSGNPYPPGSKEGGSTHESGPQLEAQYPGRPLPRPTILRTRAEWSPNSYPECMHSGLPGPPSFHFVPCAQNKANCGCPQVDASFCAARSYVNIPLRSAAGNKANQSRSRAHARSEIRRQGPAGASRDTRYERHSPAPAPAGCSVNR